MSVIRNLRKKSGLNQEEFARLFNVHQTAVSQWERGVTLPSSQMLFKLSELYGESIDYILGIDDKTEEPPFEKIETREVTTPKETLQAAFWGGEKDLSQEDLDDMWNDVERFAAFLAEKKKQEKKDG